LHVWIPSEEELLLCYAVCIVRAGVYDILASR